ncbi:unnamed protein product [Adineta steineri]|uniref:Uncharacterized protein n=1 Tax=Adineta steineri TaxID=433720 RepID=A0A813S0I1_9BILA|nr:unnamed protein product [Adineta steineri]CAF0792304.1 unnamed protein product [Adineta steineri]CAF0894455.1 unnamed protein product [Adineta steineri]
MSISIFINYRSLYFILLWSIFICPTYLIIILFESNFRWMKIKFFILFNEQGWYWLFAPYIISLIPLDIIICSLIVLPAILFFLVFIPNIQRVINYSRILILLTISFLIVFIIACTRQPSTSTHPQIIQVQHISQSMYKLNNPNRFPIVTLIYSQTVSISIKSFGNLVLSSTLDEIASKTGYRLYD